MKTCSSFCGMMVVSIPISALAFVLIGGLAVPPDIEVVVVEPAEPRVDDLTESFEALSRVSDSLVEYGEADDLVASRVDYMIYREASAHARQMFLVFRQMGIASTVPFLLPHRCRSP